MSSITKLSSMRVLVACEMSGRVRESFAAKGHDAWSCDLLPTEIPGKHFQADIREVLDLPLEWDLLIGHPDCRYLANSGVHLLKKEPGRWEKMIQGANFFNILQYANVDKVCIENPVPHGYARELIGDYTQTIQPFQFGEPESKRTCLWLRGLPPLVPTNILPKPECGYWSNQTPSGQNKLGPSVKRAQDRGRTYWGIARAMAEQWG